MTAGWVSTCGSGFPPASTTVLGRDTFSAPGALSSREPQVGSWDDVIPGLTAADGELASTLGVSDSRMVGARNASASFTLRQNDAAGFLGVGKVGDPGNIQVGSVAGSWQLVDTFTTDVFADQPVPGDVIRLTVHTLGTIADAYVNGVLVASINPVDPALVNITTWGIAAALGTGIIIDNWLLTTP